MSRTSAPPGAKLEVLISPSPAAAPAPRGRGLFVGAGLLALALGLAGSWVMQRRLDGWTAAQDGRALTQAAGMFDRMLEARRRQAASQAAVLAGDTRVRAPVMAASFDEATVRDVLEDLQTVSGASMLAMLDVSGKVRAVAGAVTLRDLDLGSSPVVKLARERPSSDLWTLPDRALVVGLAPVRPAGQTMALVVLGFDVGASFLGSVQGALGADGALLVADRIAASTTTDEGKLQALRAALALEAGQEARVGGDPGYLARSSALGRSAAAAKVAWMTAAQPPSDLRLMTWLPTGLVALTFVLLFVCSSGSHHNQRTSERGRG
jgi:hypothetical protein